MLSHKVRQLECFFSFVYYSHAFLSCPFTLLSCRVVMYIRRQQRASAMHITAPCGRRVDSAPVIAAIRTVVLLMRSSSSSSSVRSPAAAPSVGVGNRHGSLCQRRSRHQHRSVGVALAARVPVRVAVACGTASVVSPRPNAHGMAVSSSDDLRCRRRPERGLDGRRARSAALYASIWCFLNFQFGQSNQAAEHAPDSWHHTRER